MESVDAAFFRSVASNDFFESIWSENKYPLSGFESLSLYEAGCQIGYYDKNRHFPSNADDQLQGLLEQEEQQGMLPPRFVESLSRWLSVETQSFAHLDFKQRSLCTALFRSLLVARRLLTENAVDHVLWELRRNGGGLDVPELPPIDADSVFLAMRDGQAEGQDHALLLAGILKLISVLDTFSDIYGDVINHSDPNSANLRFAHEIGCLFSWRLDLSNERVLGRLRTVSTALLHTIKQTRDKNSSITWSLSDSVAKWNAIYSSWGRFTRAEGLVTVLTSPILSEDLAHRKNVVLEREAGRTLQALVAEMRELEE